ncbi:amidase [Neobacillus notoginsengisoli]|uniref:Amidase n=1 Tax=Neobacillus notoginsengisoli TaxID=1578198 RepID=A0A417YRW4_9BACI|nr:amidase [Neobacillus notoginsengisoli]RHW38037.1 amidase [Neobacillus notoginsengisoli]
MKKWHELSIVELAHQYRTKEISPVEIVDATFQRIKEQDGMLNSFITVLESEALEQAKKAEKTFMENEDVHVLSGIPFSVKDLFDTDGIRTTCGSKILKDYVPSTTAPIIKELEELGAVLIGKTNMLEFAYGIVHPDYDQTNNPWNPAKTSGGSSGGSAASVAAGLGFFSLGSDTGGSIRIPASYCGIAGLKPTYRLLSLKGVFPLSPSLDHIGPMAKTAEDLSVLMNSLTIIRPGTVYDQGKVPVVGILKEECLKDITDNVKNVYSQTIQLIKRMGWEVKEITLKYFDRTEELIMKVLLPEAALIHEKWLDRSEDYSPLTFSQIEAGLNQNTLTYLRAKKECDLASEDVDNVFKEVDIIFMPTVPYPAPDEDPALEVDDEMMFTGLFNITGHPAVSIQAGFSKDGMPIGMQLAGRKYGDSWLLYKASQLENQLAGMRGKM